MAFQKAKTKSAANVDPTIAAQELTPNPPDNHIWGIYCTIVVISIIELYSASSFEIAKQGLYAPLLRHISQLTFGFGLVLGISRIHYSKFEHYIWGLAGASVLAMLFVTVCGETVNGAKRALNLGFISVHPSEFLKLSAALVLALVLGKSALKKNEQARNRGLAKAAIIVVFFSGLLVTQGLTNTLLLMSISMSMLLCGALEWRKLGIILVIYLAVGAIFGGIKVYMSHANDDQKTDCTVLVDQFGNSYKIPGLKAGSQANSRMTDNTWGNRLKGFFSDSVPKYEQPINADNLQEMRSYMAQAHGGLFGVIPGNSRETSRLPLAFTDYIYAIVVEDLGFLGGLFVMILYLWLLARAYAIAYQCNHIYPAFLVTGCAVFITLQALFHMAIVTGAFPVSGQPLPLISKGFSSILACSIAFGVMLSVSRYTVRDKNATRAELRAETAALPKELQGENPTTL